MNCLHYSIPGTSEIRHALTHLKPGSSESAQLKSPDHLSCYRLLNDLAATLLNPNAGEKQRAESVEATELIIEELTHDQRVRDSGDEYYGVRLLQAEARSAMEEYQLAGDTSGFDRLGLKLDQELHSDFSDEISGSELTDSDSTNIPEKNEEERRELPGFVRVLIFVALLAVLVASVFLTGMCTSGFGF